MAFLYFMTLFLQPMIRPDSSISKTPDSEDDPIYSKIPELPSPTPSDYIIQPDAPLISQTEKVKFFVFIITLSLGTSSICV